MSLKKCLLSNLYSINGGHIKLKCAQCTQNSVDILVTKDLIYKLMKEMDHQTGVKI